MLRRKIISLLFFGFFSGTAWAIPTLQLDIEGGSYDTPTETIITTDPVFDLYAFGKQGVFDPITDQPLYLSIAITPQIGPTSVDFGSFMVNGTSYDVNDLIYGTPPVEAAEAIFDGGDLGKHGIFPTYFLELEFFFVENGNSTLVDAYNTQDGSSANGMMYAKTFSIDATGLLTDFGLHFDLYNTKVKNNSSDIDVDDFAPFSHDAEYRYVPEPASLLLIGLGIFSLSLRRFL